MVFSTALTGSARLVAKLALLALAAVVATLGLTGDTPRVEANHTQVVFAFTPSAPGVSSVVLPITCGVWDGQGCVSVADRRARTLYARAVDVDDPTGLGAFQVDIAYDGDLVSLPNDPTNCEGGYCIVAEPEAFLETTGRTATCSDPNEDPPDVFPIPDDPAGRWRANVSCATLGAEPLGPQANGMLAWVRLQAASGATPASTPLENQSSLLNTTEDALPIPAVLSQPSLLVAYCGDVHPPADLDGAVTAGDISGIVAAFGSTEAFPAGPPAWHPRYDLNADDSVTGGDISLVVAQFGQFC